MGGDRTRAACGDGPVGEGSLSGGTPGYPSRVSHTQHFLSLNILTSFLSPNSNYLTPFSPQLFKRIAAALPGMDSAADAKANEDLIEVKLKDNNAEPSANGAGCWC